MSDIELNIGGGCEENFHKSVQSHTANYLCDFNFDFDYDRCPYCNESWKN